MTVEMLQGRISYGFYLDSCQIYPLSRLMNLSVLVVRKLSGPHSASCWHDHRVMTASLGEKAGSPWLYVLMYHTIGFG